MPASTLSAADRQRVVNQTIELIQQGYSRNGIAQRLGITPSQAQSYERTAREQMAVAAGAQAAAEQQQCEAEAQRLLKDLHGQQKATRRLQDKNAGLTRVARVGYRSENALQDLRDAIIAGVTMPPAPEFVPAAPSGRPREDLLLDLTDGHYDAAVQPEHVNGANAYGWSIAVDRTQSALDHGLTLIRERASVRDVRTVLVRFGGDSTEGQIHDLDRYADAPLPVTAANVAWLYAQIIGDVVATCHPLGIRVLVTFSWGNHARLRYDHASQNTHAPRESWDYAIATSVAALVRDQVDGIYLPDALFSYVELNGRKGLLCHGDFLAPGKNPAQRLHKTMQDLAQVWGVDLSFAVCGHFHHESSHEGQAFVTSSPKGSDGYAYHLLRTKSRPAQALYRIETHRVVQESLTCDETLVTVPRYRTRFADHLSEPEGWDRRSPFVFGAAA